MPDTRPAPRTTLAAACLLLLAAPLVATPAAGHSTGTSWVATPTFGPAVVPVSPCEDEWSTVASPAGSAPAHGATVSVDTLGKREVVDICGTPYWTDLLSRQFTTYTPAPASPPVLLTVTWHAADVAALAAYAGSPITGSCHFVQGTLQTTVSVSSSGTCSHTLLVAPGFGFTLASNAWTVPGGAGAGYSPNPIVTTVLTLSDGMHTDTLKVGI